MKRIRYYSKSGMNNFSHERIDIERLIVILKILLINIILGSIVVRLLSFKV